MGSGGSVDLLVPELFKLEEQPPHVLLDRRFIDEQFGGSCFDERLSGSGFAKVECVHVNQVVAGRQHIYHELVRAIVSLQTANTITSGAELNVGAYFGRGLHDLVSLEGRVPL